MSPDNNLSNVRSIIAVSSCKGGVGKSTIAAQMANDMARRDLKVGLVDVDIFGPSIPSLFNLTGQNIITNKQKQLIPVERGNLKIMSFGFLLGDGPAVMRGPMATNYVRQILENTDWGKLDYLLIDMPPGTGDIQLTITQSIRLSGAVIVTTPQTLSLIDVARGILMFEKVNVPILGLIENMSYFQCDECDKKHYIFGKNTSETLQNRFGIDILAELPLIESMTHPIDGSISNPDIVRSIDNLIAKADQAKNIQEQIPDISFDQKYVTLRWNNGEEAVVANRDLRLSCQCALCINEMTGEKTLKGKDIKDDIAPTAVSPLGNYAISVTWNDRHSSGIYPYQSIKQLALT